MNDLEPYDVAMIGNISKDTLISPGLVQYVDGGAVYYAAHACARLGLKTCVYTHLAARDNRAVERLREVGVDCFPTYTPETTCVTYEYPAQNPDIRKMSVTGAAGIFSADEIAALRARAVVVGTTLRGEVGLDVIRALHALRAEKVLLAADAQGFIRILQDQTLVTDPWDEMKPILACLDIFKVDAVEAEFLTGQADVYQAVRTLASFGPPEIVLTHKDGLLVHAGGEDIEAGWSSQRLDGRSGRGDTCLGAYAGMRLSKPAREAASWAAAVTSLKMEALGPFNRSIQDVEALVQARYA